jgi:hypothetical protein
MSRCPVLAVATLAAATLVAGCFGPRYARETYFENHEIEIVLRGRTDANPGYDHPATISAVRMSHILASLDVRFREDEKKNDRTPVIPIEAVYPLGELLSGAFAKAEPNQEVVVSAKIRTRTLKIFTDKQLHSFIAYMKGDRLIIHVARVGFTLPKNPNERVREPKLGSEYQDFRVLPGPAIHPVAKQVVSVEWRDDYFRKANALRLGPGGRVKRRTILLEEPAEEAPEASLEEPAEEEAVTLPDLSPEALRALADLEEERRRGRISEADYQQRRDAILREAAR